MSFSRQEPTLSLQRSRSFELQPGDHRDTQAQLELTPPETLVAGLAAPLAAAAVPESSAVAAPALPAAAVGLPLPETTGRFDKKGPPAPEAMDRFAEALHRTGPYTDIDPSTDNHTGKRDPHTKMENNRIQNRIPD